MRPQAKTLARKAYEKWYGPKPTGLNVIDDTRWRAAREQLWPAWNNGYGTARGNVPTRRQVTT